jgi:hypothetical protein
MTHIAYVYLFLSLKEEISVLEDPPIMEINELYQITVLITICHKTRTIAFELGTVNEEEHITSIFRTENQKSKNQRVAGG